MTGVQTCALPIYSKLKTMLASAVLIFALYGSISWYLTTDHSKWALNYFVSKAESNGLIYVLLSGRTLYLTQVTSEIIDKWTVFNYFVGGQDQSKFMIEMDFFDLFLFLGLIGGVVYLILYFTTIFKFKLSKPFNLFFTFTFFLLAFLGGHFFASAINALYLCLISMYFYITQISPRQVK